MYVERERGSVKIHKLEIYSKNVYTNVGYKFLLLIDKHFPIDHKLRRVFDHKAIKLSYNCMDNIENK